MSHQHLGNGTFCLQLKFLNKGTNKPTSHAADQISQGRNRPLKAPFPVYFLLFKSSCCQNTCLDGDAGKGTRITASSSFIYLWLPFALQFILWFGALWARTTSSVHIFTAFRQQQGSWALLAAGTGIKGIDKVLKPSLSEVSLLDR